ncbi:MAG: hypothetical protein Q7S89_01630 [bacterium]|nr:hypothetical protein [bacterium]
MRTLVRIIGSGISAAALIAALSLFVARGAEAACVPHSVNGWAWANLFRFFSLSCDDERVWNPGFNPQIASNFGIDVSNNELSGYAWSPFLGWLCVGTSCGAAQTPKGDAPRATVSAQTKAVSGWARTLSLNSDYSGGWVALDCSSAGGACAGAGQPQCPGWCTVYDPVRGTLSGWGWNGSDRGTGVGWINFDPGLAPAPRYTPWVRTDFGDVYGQKGFSATNPAQAGEANATYLLVGSGPIDRWITSMQQPAGWPGGKPWPDTAFDRLEVPRKFNQYRTSVGTLYIDDLITPVDGSKNRFGQDVVEVNDVHTLDDAPLGNRVYHLRGAIQIAQPLVFKNGTKSSRTDRINPGGHGLIVIDGTLDVNANVRYENTIVRSTIQNLASAGWVVRAPPCVGALCPEGEPPIADIVRVDPAVENMVGTILIEGGIRTGSDVGNPKHLMIAGGVIARRFTFERIFTDNASGNRIGAERIVSDGRGQSNPPPGFTDLIRALPVFQQTP